MSLNKLKVFPPPRLGGDLDGNDIAGFNLQFLATGDSWFSIGGNPLLKPNGNMLDGIYTTIAACAINCAYPGDTLRRMVDAIRRPNFTNLLKGKLARPWGGLLISGGGNDLIARAQKGPETDAAERLFSTVAERAEIARAGTTDPMQRYLSPHGWQSFSILMHDAVEELLVLRDSLQQNVNIPIFMHTYDFATPRPSGAGFGAGPWLYPAVKAFDIQPEHWRPVAQHLLKKFSALLTEIAGRANETLHIVPTQGTLSAADVDQPGSTPDWRNEIHPTVDGYRKLGQVWTTAIDSVC